jgi:hypothetical protein
MIPIGYAILSMVILRNIYHGIASYSKKTDVGALSQP